MDFGNAVAMLKAGKQVSRSGWNGKGMYIYLRSFTGFENCIVMYTANGVHQPGWNASTQDVLAEDWGIVA